MNSTLAPDAQKKQTQATAPRSRRKNDASNYNDVLLIGGALLMAVLLLALFL